MMTAYEQGREIQVANGVNWRAFPIAWKESGTLLLPDDALPHVGELLSQPMSHLAEGPSLGDSNVYGDAFGETAVKVFAAKEGEPVRGTMADLMGNVALYQGLNGPTGKKISGTRWRVRGTEIKGAFLPKIAFDHKPDEEGALAPRPTYAEQPVSPAVWAMEQLPPAEKMPLPAGVPHHEIRNEMYKWATERAGFKLDMNHDDGRDAVNIRVLREPTFGRLGLFVKYDSEAFAPVPLPDIAQNVAD